MTTEEFEEIVAECRIRTGSDTQSVLENALRDYHKKVTTAAQVIEENDIDTNPQEFSASIPEDSPSEN